MFLRPSVRVCCAATQVNLIDMDTKASGGSRFWLRVALHLDVLRRSPRAWLRACWWRLQGKRVRSRAQFAPLIGGAARAYCLWLCNEPQFEGGARGALEAAAAKQPSVVVLVGPGPGQEETRRSLAGQGAQVLLLDASASSTPAGLVSRIDWCVGPWLMPLAAGDLLAPGAIAAYRAIAVRTDQRIVYADDDMIDRSGQRTAPHFKPKWNAELFRHFDFLTGACMVRTEPEDVAGLAGPGWATELVSAVAEKTRPVRLPRVLHHRRSRQAPCVPPRLAAIAGPFPKVTVIVPTRNRLDLLRKCMEGLEQTDYPDLEVIIVDNGSDDPATLAFLDAADPGRHRVLRHPGPFNFSTINNRAAKQAQGELLCLLNNDIEVIDTGWLATMVQQALRSDVGAVGARLLYPDGRIQHAGVVLGVGGGAAHAHRLLQPDEEGYFHRHALPQFVSAVTGACLVVRKTSFEAVGGLDEEKFAVAFNDVDLCMRLNARGWQSLYEPRATLIHHESVSRGQDKDPVGAARFAGELAALKAAWATDGGPEQEVDPFHHPQLSPFSTQFVVRL